MIARRTKTIARRTLLGSAAVLASGTTRARAQGDNTIRIGILNDQSGVYSSVGGRGSVVCVRQAIAEFATAHGITVDLRVTDHQNKPDAGVAIARQWFEDGVDVVADIQGSAIGLALNKLVRERNKVMLACNVGTTELDGQGCSPNTVHFSHDTYMAGNSTGAALVKQGGTSWFFIRADYAFGKSMEVNTTAFIEKSGGKVVGSIAVPFPNTDFSAALVQARASGAKVVGLAEAGTDLVTCVKQAAEFGIVRGGQKLAALLMFIQDVHALGLKTAQGLVLSNTFYWDLNQRTRAFSKRIWQAMGDAPANMSQAANYSAVLHYLKAVAALGPAEAKKSGLAAVNWMKAHKVDDDALEATIRPDGRVISPVYLFEVKAPEESGYAWDYYKLLTTTPADQAWRPLSEGGCPLAA
jgi:branched-chain amino acid transport system substrate-binding protein